MAWQCYVKKSDVGISLFEAQVSLLTLFLVLKVHLPTMLCCPTVGTTCVTPQVSLEACHAPPVSEQRHDSWRSGRLAPECPAPQRIKQTERMA